MYSNTDTLYMEKELINMFEHKTYRFYIHIWVTSQLPSRFIIPFIAAPSIKELKEQTFIYLGSRLVKIV